MLNSLGRSGISELGSAFQELIVKFAPIYSDVMTKR